MLLYSRCGLFDVLVSLPSLLHLSTNYSNFKGAVGMLLKTGHVAMVPGEGVYLVSARNKILSKLPPEARDEEARLWKENVKKSTLTVKNQHKLRSPPVIPGTAGIDRRRLQMHQRQAKEKRNDVPVFNVNLQLYETTRCRVSSVKTRMSTCVVMIINNLLIRAYIRQQKYIEKLQKVDLPSKISNGLFLADSLVR